MRNIFPAVSVELTIKGLNNSLSVSIAIMLIWHYFITYSSYILYYQELNICIYAYTKKYNFNCSANASRQ
jgi:hypothetical protein